MEYGNLFSSGYIGMMIFPPPLPPVGLGAKGVGHNVGNCSGCIIRTRGYSEDAIAKVKQRVFASPRRGPYKDY